MNAPAAPLAIETRAIRIAVMAMGGEGGGVLANWLVELGEANGHVAQMTSVPGVAQRTGATLYYIELFPQSAADGRPPVLALMPVPGDVDIVIASELMEAGRAIQRGIVTPERTTLIASTHRVFAIAEKIALADGRVDETALIDACRSAARRLVAFDMEALAAQTGSVISAVLFGALAGARVLPFPREAFEATIEHGGVGVAASRRAFAAAFAAAEAGAAALAQPVPERTSRPRSAVAALEEEAGRRFPAAALAIISAGLARCLDWQDLAHARLYLDRLKPIDEAERKFGDGSGRLVAETARQLALAMTYEDTIRVAELKIRASRFAGVAAEVGLKEGQILEIREYLHPRLQEIAETVPAPLGRFLLGNRLARRALERLTSSGRIIETTSIHGFLLLYAVASLKRFRRASLRFPAEQADLDAWLRTITATAARDVALAVEVAELRALVKGYGDTHARGSKNFAAIMARVPSFAGPSAARTLASLRQAALADETGARLAETMNKLAP